MKIYVAMVNDRHASPQPFPFSTPEAAIAFAKSEAHDYAHDESDIEEVDVEDWLYYARYSCEGDAVWVVETDLDASAAEPATASKEG